MLINFENKYDSLYKSTRIIHLASLIAMIGIIIIAQDIFIQLIAGFLLLLIFLQDINSLKIKTLTKKLILTQQELEKELYINNLTNLPNEKSLKKDLSTNPLLILSIDRFDEINSVYGIESGNIVIQSLTKLLKDTLKGEILYYYEIDKFAIIFDKLINYEEYTRNIYLKIQESDIFINNVPIKIDITMGISKNQNNQIEEAVNALQYARKNHKLYSIFSKETNISKENEKKLYWIKVVKDSLSYNTLIPFYQNIVDKNANIKSYEILMRIQMGDTILLPQQFLPIIKETPIYREMTKDIINKSINIFMDKKTLFSINLSIIDILDDEMVGFIFRKIKECNEQIKDKLSFEITENDIIKNFEKVKIFIASVKKYGIKVGIDNFGNGYSNFVHLNKLEIDYIKIDKFLIKNIENDSHARDIIKYIVDFAKEMNIKTIAQFVSNKEIFDTLQEFDIDEFQGYYFSKPQNMLKLEK